MDLTFQIRRFSLICILSFFIPLSGQPYPSTSGLTGLAWLLLYLRRFRPSEFPDQVSLNSGIAFVLVVACNRFSQENLSADGQRIG